MAFGTRAAPVLLGCTLIAACAQLIPRDTQNFKVEQQDFELIAEASIKLVERTSPVSTIVVTPGLDARVDTALKKLRPVVRSDDVQRSGEYVLPEDYFVVERFTIEDGVAQVDGEIGPITKAAEGRNIPGCGLRFSMVFFWETKAWASHSYKIIDCAKTRSWTPVT
jgi:hypothetical protein